MSQVIQYTAIPTEDFNQFLKNQEIMMRALQNLNLTPAPEYLTAQEFMNECKVSRWKFDILKNSGKLKLKQIGRKYYVARAEVARYFSGDMDLSS